MLKINRTTEYGLIALSHIRQKSLGEVTSAREIAEFFRLPFEILAKTLQKLKDHRIISSSFGTKGGYVLSHDLAKLSLGDFLEIMEGQMEVVCCASSNQQESTSDKQECEYFHHCNISPAMQNLNNRLELFLKTISLEEVLKQPYSTPLRVHPSAVIPLQGDEP